MVNIIIKSILFICKDTLNGLRYNNLEDINKEEAGYDKKSHTSTLFHSINSMLILVVIELVTQISEEYPVGLLGSIKHIFLNVSNKYL